MKRMSFLKENGKAKAGLTIVHQGNPQLIYRTYTINSGSHL